MIKKPKIAKCEGAARLLPFYRGVVVVIREGCGYFGGSKAMVSFKEWGLGDFLRSERKGQISISEICKGVLWFKVGFLRFLRIWATLF